ncbi:hypothetical protein I6F11_27640 [Ensifer sp. NBAIM29]|nr:hypothetical protein [Ensifer sp. NBAIM29]
MDEVTKVKKNLQAQRDEFEAQIKEFQVMLHGFDNGVTQFRRADTSDSPWVDITDELREDYRKAIEGYEMLVKQLDEQIAGDG